MRGEDALAVAAIYLKADPTSGAKWYDTSAKKGGGGAIDLTMHVQEL